MKLIYRIKPPCSKCPYTLGQIRTVTNPCPQCKANGYQSLNGSKGSGQERQAIRKVAKRIHDVADVQLPFVSTAGNSNQQIQGIFRYKVSQLTRDFTVSFPELPKLPIRGRTTIHWFP